MKCTHCNSEWNSANPVTSCPFCGKPLTVKPSAQPTMESVLEKIRDRIGVEALENNKKMLSCFADLAPQLKRERRVLQYFAECNGPTIMYQARNKTEQEQRRLMQQLVHKMTQELMIGEDISRKACETYVFVITGKRISLVAPTVTARPAVQQPLTSAPFPAPAVVNVPKIVPRNYPGFEIDSNGVLLRYTGKDDIVTVPPHVVKIGKEAIALKPFIQQVILLEGLEEIDCEGISRCINLQRVNLPSSLKRIGRQAFWACQSLTSISLPGHLQKIEELAFWGCYKLTRVDIQHGIRSLGGHLFDNSDLLQHVYVPDTLESIDPEAFVGNLNIYIHCSPIWYVRHGHLLAQCRYAKLIPIIKDDIREMPTLHQ